MQELISLPIIWSIVVPLVIFDLWIEIYHRSCFLLYGIKYIKRSDHIRIDRHKLKYLTWYEKIGCAYCGYGNGLMSYWTVIAGETEKYWCGIMHDKYAGFKPPEHHKNFVKYGDEEAFNERYKK